MACTHAANIAVPASLRVRHSGGRLRRALPLAMRRRAAIPLGSWPRRMPAEFAAGYCGEATVEAFMGRVGQEYPQPRVNEGRRKLWLRDDLDQAILPLDLQRVRDVVEDL